MRIHCRQPCKTILDAHNSYRAKHCVPSLTWSGDLAASAQQWASRCDFNHDDRSPLGENLFWGTAGLIRPSLPWRAGTRKLRTTILPVRTSTSRPGTSPKWSGRAASSLAAAWPCAEAITSGSADTHPLAMTADSLAATCRSRAVKQNDPNESWDLLHRTHIELADT